MATSPFSQGVGLTNGQTMAMDAPAGMGEIDDSAFSEVPQVPQGDISIDAPQSPQQVQLRRFIESTNIAQGMDQQELNRIAQQVIQGYKDDLNSREEWECKIEEWT